MRSLVEALLPLVGASILASCGPGACRGDDTELLLCARVGEDGTCEPIGEPTAGVGYRLLLRSTQLSPGAISLRLHRDGESEPIAERETRYPEEAQHLEELLVLPEVGRYRVEARRGEETVATLDFEIEREVPVGRSAAP